MEYKVVGQIFETDDYDFFKPLKGNRDVGNVKAIQKSIEDVGYMLDPILVNEKHEVVDGQHRLEALKTMGIPVKFMIQEGIGLKECQAMNTGQRNWGALDYIKSYAVTGNANYVRLLSLYSKYGKAFGLDGIIGIAYHPKEGGSFASVKDGSLTMTEQRYEIATNRMDFLLDTGILQLFEEKKLFKRVFWNAIGYAFRHPDVSIRELVERLMKSPLEIVTYSKTVDELKLFDEIYNKGRKSKKVFMATDYQLGKYKSEVM